MDRIKGKVVLDTERMRARLKARLREIGKTARGASREAGLGDSTIRNIMEGRSLQPKYDTILKLAKVLGVTVDWFLEDHISEHDEVDEKTKVDFKDHYRLTHGSFIDGLASLNSEELWKVFQVFQKDSLVVVSGATRKDGSYFLPDSPPLFQTIPRFPAPKRETHYLFQVRNTRMWPIFRRQDLLLIEQNKSFVIDEDYIFYKSEETSQYICILARLVSFDDQHFTVEYFHPRQTVQLLRAEWPRADAVVHRYPPDYESGLDQEALRAALA